MLDIWEQKNTNTDYEKMLDENKLDWVIVVVGYDNFSWKPLYPKIVSNILKRGVNVWM